MPNEDENSASPPWVKILVALISVTGVIIVGFWQLKLNKPNSNNSNKDDSIKVIQYTGRVREERTNKPVHLAKVTVEEGQKTPQIQYSDAEGVFYVKLNEDVSSVRIIVEANGYSFFDRNVSVSRTGIELIFITPIGKSVSLTVPGNVKLGQLVRNLRDIYNVKIDFNRNCPKKIQQAVVEFNGGQITGADVKDFLEKARARTNVSFSVNSIGEGSYEITCQ